MTREKHKLNIYFLQHKADQRKITNLHLQWHNFLAEKAIFFDQNMFVFCQN